MSRAKRRRANSSAKNSAAHEQVEPGSAPAIEAMTTSWMLAFMTSIACELTAGCCQLYVWKGDPKALGVAFLAGLMTLAALVAGTITLLLTAVVLKLRPEPPPRAIVAAAVLVGAIPWVAAVILWLPRA